MFNETLSMQGSVPAGATRLPWIQVAPDAPYFVTDDGRAWHPVGHNEGLSWPDLEGLFRRRDLPAVDRRFAEWAASGVTVIRLMLEYAQVRHRYFERPVGTFPPAMVQLWDDLFALSERHGIRLLLTPFDTFWTWLHWRHHPYNVRNGGPLDTPARLLLCGETRDAIKNRLAFAARRWGGSGALFAWDLWNEIHPAQAQESADGFGAFIADLSAHLRGVEQEAYGRTHPQTVSIFGPELTWRAHMPLAEPIFRHPDLDFATVHVYQHGTIDDPRDTVAPALDMARHVRAHLGEIRDGRPYLDSEHGPIHTYKDRRRTLPEDFDDEYFRHMQWAHLAAGGAGGGLRWPNRTPHRLTAGMRQAQAALSRFLPELDWLSFRRRPIDVEVAGADGRVQAMACGDERQALVYLLRADALTPRGLLDRQAPPVEDGQLLVPGLADGSYEAVTWDTLDGVRTGCQRVKSRAGRCAVPLPRLIGDLAVAVRPPRAGEGDG